MTPELELIRRIQDGDEEAFAALVDQHKERAVRTAYLFTQNWEDAKDVSQKAFIKAYRKLGTFKGESGFFTWFYVILSNTAKDFRRAHWWQLRRQQPVITEDGESDPFEKIAAKGPSSGKQSLNRELREKMDAYMHGLPHGEKEVVLLRYNDDLSMEEIAQRLGKAVGTVKAQLFSAHQKLQKHLSKYLEGGTRHVQA